ncbi:MAG: GldG family protein [Acidobacteria bacterium]|nr:GldG family protein [Acidobacteriota bacterium]
MALGKNLRKGLGSLTAVPLLIAIVIAVNLIGLFIFTRFDLTQAHLYSLSPASRHLAESLDDPIVVKLYFSEDLPAPYNANARYLKDQLYEYRAYSGGKLHFEFIDPTKTDREKEAQGLGIPPMQVQSYEKDKVELKKVYMGVAFLYADKHEIIPVVQSTSNLEYEISSAIRKITARTVPVVGFLSGHGEPALSDQMQTVSQSLQQLYDTRAVSIRPGRLIDSTISTLLIIGPADSIKAWDQYAIDQFLMHGGKLGVFYDPVSTDLQKQEATDRHTNWPGFLAHYGIRVTSGLVLDTRCAKIGVTQTQGFIRFQNVVEYPFMPEVHRFNKDVLIGKDLEQVDFPFVSPLDTTLADSVGAAFHPICWSSEHTGLRRMPYYISPMQPFEKASFDRKGQVLAGVIQGAFTSAFTQGPPADSGVNTATLPPTLSKIEDSRIVVIGDADFCSDQGVRSGSNLEFFMNIVDWLSQEEGLITIRSRDVTTRPLVEVSDGTKQLIKYANVFGPPFLVIVFGVWRWQSRRRRKLG